jgi:hypothetical protein
VGGCWHVGAVTDRVPGKKRRGLFAGAAGCYSRGMDKELESMIRLDLKAFLEQEEGFACDAAESTRDSFKMRRGAEVLILRRREDGVWEYFNPHDTGDNGTIVQYLQQRRGAGFTLGHVKHLLRGHVGRLGVVAPSLPRPPVVPSSKDLAPVLVRWQQARPVSGLPPYLEARGLVLATVVAYAPALRLDWRGNVLFAHTGPDGEIVGYEIKGRAFDGFAKGGERLLCRMGPVEGAEPVKIALTESGIDALSLAQLVGRPDALFCSTGGALSVHTLDQVERLAGRFPAAEILLGFDNDKSGLAFAATVEEALAGRVNVRRIVPQVGKDWNDVVRARQAGAGAPLDTLRLGG